MIFLRFGYSLVFELQSKLFWGDEPTADGFSSPIFVVAVVFDFPASNQCYATRVSDPNNSAVTMYDLQTKDNRVFKTVVFVLFVTW